MKDKTIKEKFDYIKFVKDEPYQLLARNIYRNCLRIGEKATTENILKVMTAHNIHIPQELNESGFDIREFVQRLDRMHTDSISGTNLDLGAISFINAALHNFQLQPGFTIQATLTQGGNDTIVTYTIARCNIGIAVAYEPIVTDFFSQANKIPADVNVDKQLKDVARSSFKKLKTKSDSDLSAEYYAIGRMELRCINQANKTVSYFIVSPGQNCNSNFDYIDNDFHGEAFIYGGFKAILNILDFSAYRAVDLLIDYDTITGQRVPCISCKQLIPQIHRDMKAIGKINTITDNYFRAR